MAPDQCIFVLATYDMTYEKEVILTLKYTGGICSTLLYINIRNHYHKYKKKDTATTICCLFYILCSFLWMT